MFVITADAPGQVGRTPRRVAIATDATLATIKSAGWLNSQNLLPVALYPTDVLDVCYLITDANPGGVYTVLLPTFSGGVITLVPDISEGNVTLPVVDNDFAVFSGTTGLLKDGGYSPTDPAQTKVAMFTGTTTANRFAVFSASNGTIGEVPASPAYHLNDINAGQSGSKGILYSFPTTAATGSLSLAAVSSAGNFATVISNASMGQATTFTLADPGTATAKISVTTAATTANHIATYANTNGGLTQDSATAINAGNIQAGLSGTAGKFTSFATAPTTGSLSLTAVANSGNFATTISNAAMGQATTFSLPDPAFATAQILVAPSSITSGHLIMGSATSGVVTDLGAAIKANLTTTFAGGGTSFAAAVAGATTAWIVAANIQTSTNSVAITKVVPTTNTLTFTFSADPGAGTVISYVALTSAV